MKILKLFILTALVASNLFVANAQQTTSKKVFTLVDKVREGDIIFQETSGAMSDAIKVATHSKFSHCGLILKKDNEWMVFEALNPVEYTSLDKWMERSKRCVVRRLRDADAKITPNVISAFKNEAKKFDGKEYDSFFNWSDERIYCSELVYKLYKNTLGIELGSLQKLKEFDLSAPEVQAQLKETYGEKIPYDEPIVSPVSILKDKNLVTVFEQ